MSLDHIPKEHEDALEKFNGSLVRHEAFFLNAYMEAVNGTVEQGMPFGLAHISAGGTTFSAWLDANGYTLIPPPHLMKEHT